MPIRLHIVGFLHFFFNTYCLWLFSCHNGRFQQLQQRPRSLTYLAKLFREISVQETTSEQRLEWLEGRGHGKSWGENVPENRNIRVKPVKWEQLWCVEEQRGGQGSWNGMTNGMSGRRRPQRSGREPRYIDPGGPGKGLEFCSRNDGKPLEGFKRER